MSNCTLNPNAPLYNTSIRCIISDIHNNYSKCHSRSPSIRSAYHQKGNREKEKNKGLFISPVIGWPAMCSLIINISINFIEKNVKSSVNFTLNTFSLIFHGIDIFLISSTPNDDDLYRQTVIAVSIERLL